MKHVLFIQGAGAGAYDEDARLAASLRKELGAAYDVRYPEMPDEEDTEDSEWKDFVLREFAHTGSDAILVGHSVGASVIERLLVENAFETLPSGVFLIASPFWYDHDFWKSKELELPPDASERIPTGLPLYFYHGRDDEFVPFEHVEMYAKLIPGATVRRVAGRNHQLNDDLSEVARDIKEL
jgi:uncharacterized protein